MNLTSEQLADLTDDGDIIELGERHAVRLRIEPDQDASLNDYDCYGKVEWIDRGHHRDSRPDGFNGAAMKLWGASAPFWWQPPAGLTAEQVRDMVPMVRDLVEYGFSMVGLELLEDIEDSHGNAHRVVTDDAWIGGVDTMSGDHLTELVTDLAAELVDLNELEMSR